MKNNMKVKAALYERVAKHIEEEIRFMTDLVKTRRYYLEQASDENTGEINSDTWDYLQAKELESMIEASEKLIAYLEKI